MLTKRQKVKALLFEILFIWPVVMFTAATLSFMFVVSLPVLLYYGIKKRWWLTDQERKALESSRKGRRR